MMEPQRSAQPRKVKIMAVAKTNAPTTPKTAPPAAAGTSGTVAAKKPRKTPEPRNLPPLDLSALSVTAVEDSQTMSKARPVRKERSKEQKAVDQLVERAYELWIAADRPKNWADAKGLQVDVLAEQYETIVSAVRKGGNHMNLRIRFGTRTDYTGTGGVKKSKVVFVAMDREEKEAATATSPDASAVDSPSAPENASADSGEKPKMDPHAPLASLEELDARSASAKASA